MQPTNHLTNAAVRKLLNSIVLTLEHRQGYTNKINCIIQDMQSYGIKIKGTSTKGPARGYASGGWSWC